MAELQARWHQSLIEIPELSWDRLLGTTHLPFYRWRWLQQLEASASIVASEGWQSCHLGLWRGDELLAVAPLYLKGHSYGEFVFDQRFAQLAAQLGLRYYPKLVGMSPVSPIEGYRFLISPDQDQAALTRGMLEIIESFCRQHRILSCNFLYVDPAWRPLAEAAGCSCWLNQQSQWTNPGLATFDDYLAGFNANQRRNIKRERRSIAVAGLQVTPMVGEAIAPALVSRMHDFYAQHCSRWGPWGSKYLSQAFFQALSEDHQLRRSLVLFSAHRGDPSDPVAMSMCVQGGDHLWGRYWGSDEDIDCLHFEVCYYAPIEWAIANGIKSFDPGAGGSHKRRRGFIAEPRVSLHRWMDPRFADILRHWLPDANAATAEEIKAINAELPFTAPYDQIHGQDP